MGASFDLSSLFERRPDEDRRRSAPYPTLGAELDAVRAHKKPIAMFPLARPGTEPDDDAYLLELARAASERGLALLVRPDALTGAPEEYRGLDAYVLPADAREVWRVPAIAALWRAALEDGGWTDAAERQLGLLLGYAADERRRWIAQVRHRQIAWGCRTVYALLSRAQRERTDELGRRCLGAPADLTGLTLFAHEGGHAMKRDAARRAPAGLAIARVGLDWKVAKRVFGRARPVRGVVAAPIAPRAAAGVNAGQRSNVELLGPRGWR